MASNKKEPEVFNLLNLYQDDDDDDDMDDAPRTQSQPNNATILDNHAVNAGYAVQFIQEEQHLRVANNDEANLGVLETSLQVSTVIDKPSIVDYAHDDLALSPEHQEGEFRAVSTGRVMQGEDLGSNDLPHRTPVGIVQSMTPNNRMDSPQLSNQVDVSQPDSNAMNESENEVKEGVNIVGENGIDSDPVQKFLPPPPKEKCSQELQDKINKFLAYKRQGKSFNVEVRNRKDYRNPDFLRHAVRYQDIDEIGSCFSKDVFDPHGYDESDYFDAIEVDMKREMERKEQERKKSPKVDFVSGGVQAGVVSTAQKVILPNPGVSNLPPTGLQSGSADILTRDVRQNKKSKWDKVDGDRRNVLGGGQDTLSLLSAANAGSGYAAFTQQKRRESEEKRSNDRKVERRS